MILCCGNPKDVRVTDETKAMILPEDEVRDYEDLLHFARKREVRVTIRQGTKAGLVAGLSVMAGVIVAGPVGAAAGGALGTMAATKMSKNVVSLNDLLAQTPPGKRHELVTVFRQGFTEEFQEAVNESPELKLMLSGASIIGVTRYMMDRNLLKSDQLDRLDNVLKKIA